MAQWWQYEAEQDAHDIKYYYEYQPGSQTAESYPPLKTNYCFVTAFYDLGRDQWHHYARGAHKYVLYFSKLVQINMPLIVFVDDRYYAEVTKLINQFNYRRTFILLIPINESFLEQYIPSWQYIATDEAIMQSSQFKAAVAHRLIKNTPETLYPRYTCFNHAKIDFVMFVQQHKLARTSYFALEDISVDAAANDTNVRTVEYLGWIDFGYVRHNDAIIPFELNEDLLMTASSSDGSSRGSDRSQSYADSDFITERLWSESNSSLTAAVVENVDGSAVDASFVIGQAATEQPQQQHSHRIHLMQTELLTPEDADPLHTHHFAPSRILGGFYFGHHSVLTTFAAQYHQTVVELHQRGIADDDQAVVINRYFKQPDMFKLWRNLNLIEGVTYQGLYVVHLLFNKHTTRRKDVQAFIDANKD